ncbi:hypothetical protein U1Q18_014271 [Sarracenia purpurea var. burkii]
MEKRIGESDRSHSATARESQMGFHWRQRRRWVLLNHKFKKIFQEPTTAISSEPQVQEDISHVEPEEDPPLDKDGAIAAGESSPSEIRLVPPVFQTFERKKKLPKDIHIDAS